MGTYVAVTDLDEFEASWARIVKVQEVEYQGGLKMLRVRIREGNRFTDLELLPDTARRLAGGLLSWAETDDAIGSPSR